LIIFRSMCSVRTVTPLEVQNNGSVNNLIRWRQTLFPYRHMHPVLPRGYNPNPNIAGVYSCKSKEQLYCSFTSTGFDSISSPGRTCYINKAQWCSG